MSRNINTPDLINTDHSDGLQFIYSDHLKVTFDVTHKVATF